MHDIRTGSGLIHRGLRRVLDGDRRWGSIDIRPDRFGVTRYRLVVFPPGITDAERRRVRVARGWLLWGALVWVFCEILLNQMTGPWTALVASTGIYLGLGLVATSMAGTAQTGQEVRRDGDGRSPRSGVVSPPPQAGGPCGRATGGRRPARLLLQAEDGIRDDMV